MADSKISAMTTIAPEDVTTSDWIPVARGTSANGKVDLSLVSAEPMFHVAQGGGWRDINGQAINPTTGATIPTWTQMGSSAFWGHLYAVDDQQWYLYHLPHDYAPGTSLYLHVHWVSNGTNVGLVKWQLTWTFAKGFNQGAASTFDLSTVTASIEEAGAGTAWRHMVSEIATPIADADFEVDGILMVNVKRVTPSTGSNSDSIFVLMADVHYQSDTFNTKNRVPNFYT